MDFGCLRVAVIINNWLSESESNKKASESPAATNLPEEEATANNSQTVSGELKSSKMCLIHGGMDTEGELYNDLLVLLIEP